MASEAAKRQRTDAAEALAGNVSVSLGTNDLPMVTLTHPNGAHATVCVYGAHVTSWVASDGHERLFLSSASAWEVGQPIRGGIPLCWPQFSGRGPLPKHGLVRTATWDILSMRSEDASSDLPTLTLGLSAAPNELLPSYPHAFSAALTVTLGADTLSLCLRVTNENTSEPIEFTCALHTYFSTTDSTRATVTGLRGLTYEDNAAGGARAVDTGDAVAIEGEIDRAYLDTPIELRLSAPSDDAMPVTCITKSASLPDAVVWNIGEAKAPNLPDIGEGEWRRYVCVEAAAVGKPVLIKPGEIYTASQTLTAGAPPAEQ